MSYSTQGASNRQVYDCCAYAQTLQQSVDPLQYQLYFGAQENCSKCIDKKAWYKQDKQIIDIESDLLLMTRPLSKCDQYKYNPNCESSQQCISTFDPNIPRILSPSLCPIVYNNIPVITSPGYALPDSDICSGKTDFTEADNVNTFRDYNMHNKKIIADNNDPQSIHMFLNSCNNQPLYNGGFEKITPAVSHTKTSLHNPSTNHAFVNSHPSKIPISHNVSNVGYETNYTTDVNDYNSDSEYN